MNNLKPMCVICLKTFEWDQVCESSDFLIRCDECLNSIPTEHKSDLPPLELLQ